MFDFPVVSINYKGYPETTLMKPSIKRSNNTINHCISYNITHDDCIEMNRIWPSQTRLAYILRRNAFGLITHFACNICMCFKIVCKNGNKIKIKKYINSVLRIGAELCCVA